MYELVVQEYISVINTKTDEEIVHIELDDDMNVVVDNIEKLVMLLNNLNS